MAMPDRFIGELERRRFSPLDLIDKEHLVEKVLALTLAGQSAREVESPFFGELLEDFAAFRTDNVRTVIFGGGSGLSSIVGGNNRWPTWAETPCVGLKRLFDHLTVGVCTTDDGGGTGLILKSLELIAVGDLRKVCLSMVRPDRLDRLYGVGGEQCRHVVSLLQRIINHRFQPEAGRFYEHNGAPSHALVRRLERTEPGDLRVLLDPLVLFAPEERRRCPAALHRYFRQLGALVRAHPQLERLPLTGNCLGNLQLVASIFQQTPPGALPGAREVRKGVQAFADRIGAPGRNIHPATTTPGQLRYLYGNGVMVYGQQKALTSRRRYPVERVLADYVRRPRVEARLVRAIQEADLILFAPGSVFSSLVPILQIEPLTRAIRANRHALKILAGNFWVQEGETDVTRRGPGARYHVSDMVEAYHRNVRGGVSGIFHQILVADLQQLPGNVLRNYALEGKLPIFLDRARVRQMGFEPLEAPVFARDMLERRQVLHHDPERFALAVKTLLYMKSYLRQPGRPRPWREQLLVAPAGRRRASPAGYMAAVDRKLEKLDLRTDQLRRVFRELVWQNRDILPAHLDQLVGIKVIPASRWRRSTAWDKVLGYFDPEDRYVKIHRQLLHLPPERLYEDILIGLGEALLGRYCREKRLTPLVVDGEVAGKVYSLRLAPVRQRLCFLDDAQLRTYLGLAKMVESRAHPDTYRIVINGEEAFMPPGLLFGLLYAWYLNNTYGGAADYDMSLVRWKVTDLIPKQTEEMMSKRRLIAFFRSAVFRHDAPEVESILEAARRGV